MSGLYRMVKGGVEYDSEIFGTVTFPVITMDEIYASNMQAKMDVLEEHRKDCFGSYYGTYHKASFTDLDAPEKVVNEVSTYCNDLCAGRANGRGLMLVGNNGVGKTWCAAIIANEALNAGLKVCFTSMRDLISWMPYGADPKVINRLMGYDLVVLDDLGAERRTETGCETAFTVIDKLYGRKVPVVVTTNLSRQQIDNPDLASRRLMDRLKERCRLVEYVGRNRRQVRIGE